MSAPARDERQRVGPYALITKLGEGGMGVVHLARGPEGERVALKVLRPHVVGDDEGRRRLEREVASLSLVHSRWVAPVLDADPWAPVPYVATRYVPGLSVHDHVLEEGPIHGSDLVWFAGGLAEGIAAVHAAGVLHRDVKPSNVLMEGRAPILIDFGLAKLAEDSRMTRTGFLLGTPGYVAPEVLVGEEATTASDVHAWAATVAYAGTGRSPFGRGPIEAVLDRVRRGEFDLTGIHGDLTSVLAAALDPEPSRRPRVEQLLAWLRPQTSEVAWTADEIPETQPFAPSARPADVTRAVPLAGAAAAAAEAAPTPAPTAVEPVWADPAPVADEDWSSAVTGEVPVGGGDTRMLREGADGLHWGASEDATVDRPTVDRPWVERPWDGDADEGTEPAWPWAGEEVAPAAPVGAGERLRRGLLWLVVVLALGAGVAAYPYVAGGAVVAAAWLLRAGSRGAARVSLRQGVRGHRWHDAPRRVVGLPWDLSQTLLSTLLLLVWGVGLAVAAVLVCYALALDDGRTALVGGLALVTALLLGPGSDRVRGPVGALVRPLASGVGTWLVLLVVLGALAAAGATAVLDSGADWAPASDWPLAGLSLPSWLVG
ncbi:serine/threonine-protein kinase [Nocardioides sp. GY 10127]|uniref:serine/threonine-protein kinase n=1 Tax=Nocardioides sp. GY 10127 TaxID=2569762 RepID=UPI0010A7B49D|nr:serine/threonine-protein kinase [Nocardioides sp. GY 10127]TIC80792.1 serine/threonine protein kinase [Nocardioides sp. GY 10127]